MLGLHDFIILTTSSSLTGLINMELGHTGVNSTSLNINRIKRWTLVLYWEGGHHMNMYDSRHRERCDGVSDVSICLRGQLQEVVDEIPRSHMLIVQAGHGDWNATVGEVARN